MPKIVKVIPTYKKGYTLTSKDVNRGLEELIKIVKEIQNAKTR